MPTFVIFAIAALVVFAIFKFILKSIKLGIAIAIALIIVGFLSSQGILPFDLSQLGVKL